MNIVFHFLFNYLFLDAVFGNASSYLVIIFVFSVILDFDHLPYLIKNGRAVVKKRFGSESRTRLHEIYGLAVISAISCLLYLLMDKQLVVVAASCLVLHLCIDFLTGKSVPFSPYSKREVIIGISPSGYAKKIVFETATTFILGVLFCLQIASLVL